MDMAEQPELTDSHCHLDFPDFADDLDGVVARANERGVRRIVTICTSLGRSDAVAHIAESYSGVYFAAGTHPHKAASDPLATVERLTELAQHPKMIAIGESGLDYHYTRETADRQKRSFAVHIEAARRTGLPLIVHSRDACSDMADILTREHAAGAFSCVMHCFSSGPDLARAALDLDFYLSMSGITTFSSAEELRKIFAAAPPDRILIETDAPYLAPVPHRGRRNEPAFAADVAAAGARLFDRSPADFAALTTGNFDRLFSKASGKTDS